MKKEELLEIKKKIERLKVAKAQNFHSMGQGYLGIDAYIVTLNDGSIKEVECLTKSKKEGHAVVIIPVTKEGKYVLIVESRPNVSDGVCLEFPAGMVDLGEEPSASAMRELTEETGYECEKIEQIEWHYQDQGCSSAIIYTFLATYCKKVKKQDLDEFEKIETILVTEEELEKLIMGEDIGLGLTIDDANSKIAGMKLLLSRKSDKNE